MTPGVRAEAVIAGAPVAALDELPDIDELELGPENIGRPRKGRSMLAVLVWQIVVALLLLGVWVLVDRLELVRPLLMRSPREVWDAGWEMAESGLLWENVWSTLQAVVVGFALSSIVGVVVGLGLALVPRVERVVTPFLSAMNASPRIAFAPVFIVAFGIGNSAKVALAFSVVVFVVIFSARAGVYAADPDTVRLLEVMGASRRQIFLKLLLPVATPSIFAGLRLGLIYSLLGVVTSEMIAGRAGMGTVVARYSSNFQLENVYAAIYVLVVLGSLLNTLAVAVERRLLWWLPPSDSAKR